MCGGKVTGINRLVTAGIRFSILGLTTMSSFLNIAAYKFVRLDDLKPLRDRLLASCRGWGLKGTILLSPEGINLFVAGDRESVESLVSLLRSLPGLEDLTPKFSESADQPFTRMLVRIKKEIIAFGVEGINPAERTSPKLAPATLKDWLDEGRPVNLLDTRNDYEVKLGTFRGAHTLDIAHFRQFPEAVKTLPAAWKDQPVVMFCTGGIRCEKAGPLMEREGFRSVFQLDGGILKYFEECGGAHYDGECFVFDQRVGVDPALRETESALCFACQTPLKAEETEDPRYVPGQSCPYCFAADREAMVRLIAEREEALRLAATPLPGSVPWTNRRPVRVPGEYDGSSLVEMLSGLFPHAPETRWRSLCEEGMFADADGQVVGPGRRVRAGERYERLIPNDVEPGVNADIRILHEDEALLVLNKPAPLPMHPAGRFHRNTLQFLLNAVYAPQKPRSLHRLDAGTTGVVVFARTRFFAKRLQPQFEDGGVEKIYRARVQGWPREESFRCDLPVSAGPGVREIDEAAGQPAETAFRVLRREADGTALVEARPVTGRTNQIRLHLWHLGHPVCGDPVYRPDGVADESMAPELTDPPLLLHAWRVTLLHPLSGERVVFSAPVPEYLGEPSV